MLRLLRNPTKTNNATVCPVLKTSTTKAKVCLVSDCICPVTQGDAVQVQSRLAWVGNVAGLNATIDKLSTLHGGGGSEVKRQKSAQGAMSVLKTSVAVASANFEEAKPKE